MSFPLSVKNCLKIELLYSINFPKKIRKLYSSIRKYKDAKILFPRININKFHHFEEEHIPFEEFAQQGNELFYDITIS